MMKRQEEDNKWKEDIIQKEKERLLREHLPYIDGFMPKSIIQAKEDTKFFTNSQQFNPQIPQKEHHQNLTQSNANTADQFYKRRHYKKTRLW